MARRRNGGDAIGKLLAFNPEQLEAQARAAAREETPFERKLPAAAPDRAPDAPDTMQWLWDFAAAEMGELRRQLADEQALRGELEKQLTGLRARAAAEVAHARRLQADLEAERAARIAAEREAAALLAQQQSSATLHDADRRVAALQEALAAEIQQREALAEEARQQRRALAVLARRREAEQVAQPPAEDVAALTQRFKQLARVLIAERRERLISEQHMRRLLRAQGLERPDDAPSA